MANKFFGTKLFAAALTTFALASCQSESTLLEPTANNLRDVELTVTVSKGEMPTRTNLNLSEDQKNLLVTWNKDEIIQVSEPDGTYAGYLTVTELLDNGKKALFKGTIRTIDEDGTHKFTFAALGDGVEYSAKRGYAMDDMVYDFSSQVNSGVTALAKNDLLIADGDVEIKGGKASFNDLLMKRQFAFGRFTLLYNDQPLQFDANTVVYVNTENNDIKTGATLEFPKTITPAGNSSIALTTSKNDFYVTFVPGSSESKIKFNVTINDVLYEGYSNTYLIEANDFYRKAQGLTYGEALPINVRKTDGSDDEHDFNLTYNQNFGPKDTWTDTQKGVGFTYTYTLSDYDKIFNDKTNEGYTFVGWTVNPDGTGDVLLPNATLPVTYPDGNATVYAKWEKTVYEYTLNWETADGDPINTQTKETDEDPYKWAVENKQAEQEAPEGYEFAGWADKAVDPNTPVVEVKFTKDRREITVVPVYTEKDYNWTVTWKNGYDDNPIKTKEYKGKDGSISISNDYPADPKRDGYTFVKWDKYIDKLSKNETNVVITAQWKKDVINYVLTYHQNLNGSTLKQDDQPDPATTADSYDFTVVKYEDLGPDWTSTTPAEYKFIGWNTQADGKGKTYSPGDLYKLTKDQITGNLYAMWEEVKKTTVSTPGYSHGEFK